MRAYYNEIDGFCCAWLSNLMDAGHITPGEIDDRDIREVQARDLEGFERVHFFAGIGGWDLALNLAGWGSGPIWSASCPCPPFSQAGKRRFCPECDTMACLYSVPSTHWLRNTEWAMRGKPERHAWPEGWRLAAESRPRRNLWGASCEPCRVGLALCEYEVRWKFSVTLLELRICRLRGSRRRTSDSGFGGWRTQTAEDGVRGVSKAGHDRPRENLTTQVVGWATARRLGTGRADRPREAARHGDPVESGSGGLADAEGGPTGRGHDVRAGESYTGKGGGLGDASRTGLERPVLRDGPVFPRRVTRSASKCLGRRQLCRLSRRKSATCP